eukprot:1689287-Rhodomonas_salina.1
MRRAASGLDNFLSSSPKILNGSEEENEELEEEDFVDSSKMYACRVCVFRSESRSRALSVVCGI